RQPPRGDDGDNEQRSLCGEIRRSLVGDQERMSQFRVSKRSFAHRKPGHPSLAFAGNELMVYAAGVPCRPCRATRGKDLGTCLDPGPTIPWEALRSSRASLY